MHWSEIFIFVACLSVIQLAGYLPLASRRHKVGERRGVLFGYRETFIEWLNSDTSRHDLYNALIAGCPKAQHSLGQYGVLTYRAPFGQFVANNWQVLMNAIPMIHAEFNDWVLRKQAIKHAALVDESLLRGIGAADFDVELLNRQIRNPVRVFVAGVQWVLSLPVLLLAEFGLLSTNAVVRLRNSALFKSLSAAAFSLALLSAVMSIILGWSDFWAVMIKWLGSFGLF